MFSGYLRRLIPRLLIVVAVFVFASVWFCCHRAEEMRAARGVVLGVVE